MSDQHSMHDISRRGFIAAAAVGTAACAGLATQSGTTRTPAIAEEPAAADLFDGDEVAGVAVQDVEALRKRTYQIDMKNVEPIPALKEPPAYDYETDVLLIGYGVGGTSAALTAVNRGVSVLAMERSDRAHWYEHGGVHFIWAYGVPEWLEQEGIEKWDEDFVREWVLDHTTSGMSLTDLDSAVKYYLDMPKAFQQIREADPEATELEMVSPFPSMDHLPNFIPVNANLGGNAKPDPANGIGMYPTGNKYFAVENALDRIVQSKGGVVLWGTRATNLIADEAGKVVGAKGVDQAGNLVYVKAKAVIDCVGGFGANYDMVKYVSSEMDQAIGFCCCPLANDGTGIRMAQGAGAGLRGTPHPDQVADAGIDAIGLGLQWNLIYEIPSPVVVGGFATIAVRLGRQPLLKVNKYGKRFMDEAENWTNKVKYAYKQPDHRFFTIFDSTINEFCYQTYDVLGRWGACERISSIPQPQYYSDDMIAPGTPSLPMDLDPIVAKGLIYRADTIEELAEICDLDPQTLRETVDNYNAMCEAGVDTEYGKDPDMLWPVTEPPFYACEREAGFAWACGSILATDKYGHVLNKRGVPIPGLYCGANDASMLDYSTNEFFEDAITVAGSANAVAMGYIAMTAAADEILGGEGSIGAVIVNEPTGRMAAAPASDEAKAGKAFIDANCNVCHTPPSKANFGDLDSVEQIVAEFADHDLVSFPEEEMRNVAAWVAE